MLLSCLPTGLCVCHLPPRQMVPIDDPPSFHCFTTLLGCCMRLLYQCCRMCNSVHKEAVAELLQVLALLPFYAMA